VRGESFLLLAMAAQKFGARPSELVGLGDPVLALDFDLAAAARLLAAQRAAETDLAANPGGETLPPRLREERW